MIPLLATLVVRAVCDRSLQAPQPTCIAVQPALAPDRDTAPDPPILTYPTVQEAARAPPVLPALAPADAQTLLVLFTALARRQADPNAPEVTTHEQQNLEHAAHPQSLRLCPPIDADPNPAASREHRTPIPAPTTGDRPGLGANPGRGD